MVYNMAKFFEKRSCKSMGEKVEQTQQTSEEKALIAISNTLARAKDGMTMQEKKLCAIYLSKIEWKNLNNNREIWVEKSEIMKLLNSEIDASHQSYYLRTLAQNMVRHSELHFDGKEDGEWEDMPLFTRRKSTKGLLMIEVYDGAMKLLEGLKSEYITLFLSDILNFDSNETGRRAYVLYEYLRLHSDTRQKNSRLLSTKELKELWGISADAYMHLDQKRNKEIFDRANFEKRVLLPVLKLLDECKHVVLHNYGMDKNKERVLFQKIKKGGMVAGYELTYSINKFPRAIKKETIVDVQANPVTLKVAQDIIDGKKKQKEKGTQCKKKNSFNAFPQREYTNEQIAAIELQNKKRFASASDLPTDVTELEKRLLERRKK